MILRVGWGYSLFDLELSFNFYLFSFYVRQVFILFFLCLDSVDRSLLSYFLSFQFLQIAISWCSNYKRTKYV